MTRAEILQVMRKTDSEENSLIIDETSDTEDNCLVIDETSDTENNCLVIDESRDTEENCHDMECIYIEDHNDEVNMRICRSLISEYKRLFEISYFHKFRNIKKLLQLHYFENPEIMELIKKMDSGISFIKNELKYWDGIDALTPKEVKTLIVYGLRKKGKNPLADIQEEERKLREYLDNIDKIIE